MPEITSQLANISIQVENFDQLKGAIKFCLNNPAEKSEARKENSRMMFDQLDGKAGKRAAEIIKAQFPGIFH